MRVEILQFHPADWRIDFQVQGIRATGFWMGNNPPIQKHEDVELKFPGEFSLGTNLFLNMDMAKSVNKGEREIFPAIVRQIWPDGVLGISVYSGLVMISLTSGWDRLKEGMEIFILVEHIKVFPTGI